MKTRKPTYHDLLQCSILQTELDQLIGHLKTDSSQQNSVTEQTEVDEPIYWNGAYFHTALCFATRLNNIKIVRALLEIGANPHLINNRTLFGSILLIAARNKNGVELFKLLLAIPNMDPYVSYLTGETLFKHSKGNTEFILNLLQLDPAVAVLPQVEKTKISVTIAEAVKGSFAYQINGAICQSLNESAYKDYVGEKEQKLIEESISQASELVKIAPPLHNVILSYLFLRKPKALLDLEELQLSTGPGAKMKNL